MTANACFSPNFSRKLTHRILPLFDLCNTACHEAISATAELWFPNFTKNSPTNLWVP